MLDGELDWLTDGLEPRDGETIHDQIEASGAPALLLERYAGARVPRAVAPRRDVSHLFRGEADRGGGRRPARRARPRDLRLVDNGAIMQAPMPGSRARTRTT